MHNLNKYLIQVSVWPWFSHEQGCQWIQLTTVFITPELAGKKYYEVCWHCTVYCEVCHTHARARLLHPE